MSNLVQISNEQIELIRSTIAKNATPDEFKLFMYRCQSLGLDPLRPGQIHFVKYGSTAGTIVIGLDGFRSIANKTGKHCGTKRGLIRNDSGKCIGAWAEIFRTDWTNPARIEVSLDEYDAKKAMWLKMPETMIQKVAEVGALRMAFPDDLGGLYSTEEMDQAERQVQPSVESKSAQQLIAPVETKQEVVIAPTMTGQDIKDVDWNDPMPTPHLRVCTVCNTPLQLSSKKTNWFCKNWQDGKGKHTVIKAD